jgi:hypothetical protein
VAGIGGVLALNELEPVLPQHLHLARGFPLLHLNRLRPGIFGRGGWGVGLVMGEPALDGGFEFGGILVGEHGFGGAAAVSKGILAGFGFPSGVRGPVAPVWRGWLMRSSSMRSSVGFSGDECGGWGVRGGSLKQRQAIDLEWNGRFGEFVMPERHEP